jgi:hypothetical protein
METNGSRKFVLAMMLLLAACQDRNQSAGPSSTGTNGASPAPMTSPDKSPATSADYPTDKWLGQWNGPEGTYLLLSKKDNRYVVKIQSLDGPNIYEGVPARDGIQFTRGGNIETIHAGSGEDTGMKWLLDEKNCLVIKLGEGFCRK